jgi:hypothetical protein
MVHHMSIILTTFHNQLIIVPLYLRTELILYHRAQLSAILTVVYHCFLEPLQTVAGIVPQIML